MVQIIVINFFLRKRKLVGFKLPDSAVVNLDKVDMIRVISLKTMAPTLNTINMMLERPFVLWTKKKTKEGKRLRNQQRNGLRNVLWYKQIREKRYMKYKWSRWALSSRLRKYLKRRSVANGVPESIWGKTWNNYELRFDSIFWNKMIRRVSKGRIKKCLLIGK